MSGRVYEMMMEDHWLHRVFVSCAQASPVLSRLYVVRTAHLAQLALNLTWAA